MNNVTKVKILKPANEVFEAFVDPDKIKHFWFSSSSERWEQGKEIVLEYKEYNAQLTIEILEININKKIKYKWDANGVGHIVTIDLQEISEGNTIVEINEDGFDEVDDDYIAQILDNKEGWVFMLVCLKGYLEFGISKLRGGLVKD